MKCRIKKKMHYKISMNMFGLKVNNNYYIIIYRGNQYCFMSTNPNNLLI